MKKGYHFLLLIILLVIVQSCKTSQLDPKPKGQNLSNLPGSDCILTELKYFAKDNDSLLGGVQLKYSAAGKLTNILYYSKGQNPGDNGYYTLVYNSADQLTKLIINIPERIVSLGQLTATIPTSNFANEYTYEGDKLKSAKIGKNTNEIFNSGNNLSNELQFDYTYFENGNLNSQIFIFNYTSTGLANTTGSEDYFDNYFNGRPKNKTSKIISKSTVISESGNYTTDFSSKSFQQYEYDGNGNKLSTKFLYFPDSIEAKINGASISGFENIIDSVSLDVVSTFDITKSNPLYAFRFLHPENINEIDRNIITSATIGCLTTKFDYEFDEINNVPTKSMSSFTVDKDCEKLDEQFKKLNSMTGNSVTESTVYTRYYYSGCK